jgi:hypothetical protein
MVPGYIERNKGERGFIILELTHYYFMITGITRYASQSMSKVWVTYPEQIQYHYGYDVIFCV